VNLNQQKEIREGGNTLRRATKVVQLPEGPPPLAGCGFAYAPTTRLEKTNFKSPAVALGSSRWPVRAALSPPVTAKQFRTTSKSRPPALPKRWGAGADLEGQQPLPENQAPRYGSHPVTELHRFDIGSALRPLSSNTEGWW